jgi:hypothetical protein
MANTLQYQVLKDTTEHATIKLTGYFDGTGGQENDHFRIKANSLYGALATNGFPVANVYGGAANTALSYYNLQVNRIWYDCSSVGEVSLFWDADTVRYIAHLDGSGEYDGMGNWVTIPNDARGTANCFGDIGLVTRGMLANSVYTIIIELRKDNAFYQRGQFNDPAAFNYGAGYALRP